MRISIFVTLALAACDIEPTPEASVPADLERTSGPSSFLDEVISTFGRDGESCYPVGREIVCVTANKKMALAVGDSPPPTPKDLSLCTQLPEGSLDPNSCEPLESKAETHCHVENVGECEWLAILCDVYEGEGSCGDCQAGDCCCKT